MSRKENSSKPSSESANSEISFLRSPFPGGRDHRFMIHDRNPVASHAPRCNSTEFRDVCGLFENAPLVLSSSSKIERLDFSGLWLLSIFTISCLRRVCVRPQTAGSSCFERERVWQTRGMYLPVTMNGYSHFFPTVALKSARISFGSAKRRQKRDSVGSLSALNLAFDTHDVVAYFSRTLLGRNLIHRDHGSKPTIREERTRKFLRKLALCRMKRDYFRKR